MKYFLSMLLIAALGVTEEMLLDGVVVASKEQFFSFTDGRILTLDY